MQVIPYNSSLKTQWDDFVEHSRNGTFLFKRAYMEYHADRFTDFSLMFYKDDKLVAVMPASIHGNQVRSHGGLTYGGIISNTSMKTKLMLDVFEALVHFLREHNVRSLIYKRVPSIYHLYPSDEDLYALFRYGAKLIRRDISVSILLEDAIKFSELRKRCVKRAVKNNLKVQTSTDYVGFVNMVNTVLSSRHEAKAVHTAKELQSLAEQFPNNIRLVMAFNTDRQALAGVIVYDTSKVVHLQYIANSDEGCQLGALDLIVDTLIREYSKNKRYFDFGISTEKEGRYLNEGLIAQKEGFGGRGIAYDFYELSL